MKKETSNNVAIVFLKSFFCIFNATIESLSIENEVITGVVGWDSEEDKQDFLWDIPKVASKIIIESVELIDYLLKNNLMMGDKIITTRDELIERLEAVGWDLPKIDSSINFVVSTTVPMLDEGEKTDSFFVHF